MTPPSSSRFLAAVRQTQAALDQAGAPAMLIGGVAVIAHGVPRTTLDVDATVDGAAIEPEALLARWQPLGLVPRMDGAAAFARQHQVLLLQETNQQVPVDVTLAWLPFETAALARSELLPLGPLRVRVPNAEDLLVYKLVAGRPKDREDAKHLLLLHRDAVDLTRLRAVLADFAEAIESDAPLRVLHEVLQGGSGP